MAELYVCHDSVVKDCFWGDYIEGYLVVNGTITLELFISTNHYGFEFDQHKENNGISINHYLSDEEGETEGFPRSKIASLITEDCLFEEADLHNELYSWDNWLNKDKMIEYLTTDSRILNIQN